MSINGAKQDFAHKGLTQKDDAEIKARVDRLKLLKEEHAKRSTRAPDTVKVSLDALDEVIPPVDSARTRDRIASDYVGRDAVRAALNRIGKDASLAAVAEAMGITHSKKRARLAIVLAQVRKADATISRPSKAVEPPPMESITFAAEIPPPLDPCSNNGRAVNRDPEADAEILVIQRVMAQLNCLESAGDRRRVLAYLTDRLEGE